MLALTPTGLVIRASRPLGYCDHFGLRRIAENQARADRLIAALKASGGSLALSWLNLGEYATVTDYEQRLQAERLLDRIAPAIFPLDVDLGAVSKRELAGKPDPHADRDVAIIFVKARPSISASGIDYRITAAGVFDPLNHPRLIRGKDRLARITQQALKKLQQQYVSDPAFRRVVMRAEQTPQTQAPTTTDAVARTIAATLFPDLRREISLNGAIDFLHAVVPAAFCDAVLLDGAMCDAVERARRRLPHTTIAAPFSGRGDGIDRFIDALAVAPG